MTKFDKIADAIEIWSPLVCLAIVCGIGVYMMAMAS